MKFIREYKIYQIYKNDNMEIASSDNTGSSRLIKNDIVIFLPDTIIELGNEIESFKSEKEAIEYIDDDHFIDASWNFKHWRKLKWEWLIF